MAQSGRRGKEVAGDIRGAFKRACLLLDGKGEKGSGLTELIRDSLLDDVKGTLTAIKGFVPKELDIDASIGAKELTSEEWLERLDNDRRAE